LCSKNGDISLKNGVFGGMFTIPVKNLICNKTSCPGVQYGIESNVSERMLTTFTGVQK
jgi:hypothetical protein